MRRLINELSKLPSIGEKSAGRLAYHLLTGDSSSSLTLAESIREAVSRVSLCSVCYFISETPICPLCQDDRRNYDVLCVVEKPADILALEKSGGYRGLYHVLHGVWSPLRGIGPEQTKIAALLKRLRIAESDPAHTHDRLELPLKELILATSTTVEGDATALYIAGLVEELGVPVTRIAQGMPKGGELEYADELTLNLSLEGRRSM
jgi:recombination protein RecR